MAQQNNRARQQRIILIFILAALILLVGGAFAILGGSDKPRNQAAPRPAGMVTIPIASRNIQLGERISTAMVTMKYLSPQNVPEDIMLRTDLIVGRYATKPIPQATYFKEDGISEPDVSGGYSAVAKPGKRVVVINANQLPGVIGTLRVGDHIDLLAIATADTGSGAVNSNAPSKEQLRYEYMRGGTQPGTPPRKQAAKSTNPANTEAAGLTASLIAENAEVMRVPSRGKDKELVVLQMNPQDAHVTTLMVAAGSMLRVVFRPSNDDDTILAEREIKVTTRMPKPEPDPDQVAVILGAVKTNARPESSRFESAATNDNYGKQKQLSNERFSDLNGQLPIQMLATELPGQVYD